MMPPSNPRSADPHLVEQLRFMLRQEAAHYRCGDGLSLPGASIHPSDRRKVGAWSYDVVESCSFPREAACVGLSYLDRYLCAPSARARTARSCRREFQLASVACLVVALKCRAGTEVETGFVSGTVCQGLYTDEEVNGMEREVLGALRWRLNGPSPHEFVAGLIELLPSCARENPDLVRRLTEGAKTYAEEAMLDYSTAIQSPSSIAYAALMNALEGVELDAFHPLDRLLWMQNIMSINAGLKAADTNARVARDQSFDAMEEQLPSPSAMSPPSVMSPKTYDISYNDVERSASTIEHGPRKFAPSPSYGGKQVKTTARRRTPTVHPMVRFSKLIRSTSYVTN